MCLKLGASNWMKAAPQGIAAMPRHQHPAVCLTIGAVVRDVETGKYLASLANGNPPIEVLLAVVFILSRAMAFATGTSWGTLRHHAAARRDMAAASDQPDAAHAGRRAGGLGVRRSQLAHLQHQHPSGHGGPVATTSIT